jgi:hypothetical protein
MTKERIIDVQNALRLEGWEISSLPDSSRPGDLFNIEHEMIEWQATHGITNAQIKLQFNLFGHLGSATEDFKDVLYCRIEGHDIKLYFAKRNTDQWRHDLPEFIAAIGRLSGLPP